MSTVAITMDLVPEYGVLLGEALPAVVRTEEQNEAYVERVGELLRRGADLSAAERELAALLTVLIEDFESQHYGFPKGEPVEVVRFLMDQHGLKQKDLTDVFGTASITSEVLNGKRELNKEQIRRLSARFGVSVEAFF